MQLERDLLKDFFNRCAVFIGKLFECCGIKDGLKFRQRCATDIRHRVDQIARIDRQRRAGALHYIGKQGLIFGPRFKRGHPTSVASRNLVQAADQRGHCTSRILAFQCILCGDQTARLIGGFAVPFGQRLYIARQIA